MLSGDVPAVPLHVQSIILFFTQLIPMVRDLVDADVFDMKSKPRHG